MNTNNVKGNFIIKFLNESRKMIIPSNVNTVLLLGIMAFEGGWGTSPISKIANNYTGITASKKYIGKVYCNNKIYDSYDLAPEKSVKYKYYTSMRECIFDYCKLMQTNRYKPVVEAKSIIEAANNLVTCGYCPDKQYSRYLLEIIISNDLFNVLGKPFEQFDIVVIYTGKDGVNIRTTPSIKDDNNIKTVAYYGTKLTVVGYENGMYKLNNGCYISSNSNLVDYNFNM